MKYELITGDFVAICHLSDLTGRDRRRTPSYNEGGLMVLDDTDPKNQQIVQMGIFPNYNCGNMLTTVSHHGRRPQFPRGNSWQYDPWLMIERQGDTFIVRTSADGQQWTETTGSPVEMRMPEQVKVGLFQVTYTDNEASATFDHFTIYQQAKK